MYTDKNEIACVCVNKVNNIANIISEVLPQLTVFFTSTNLIYTGQWLTRNSDR